MRYSLLFVSVLFAAVVLAQQRQPTAESLIQQYKNATDTPTKFNILVQMGQIRDDRLTRFLGRRFGYEKDATIRRQILWTLAQIATKKSAETLAELSYAFEEPEITSAARPITNFLKQKGLLWVYANRLVKKRASRYGEAQSALAEVLPTEGEAAQKSLKVLKGLLRSRDADVRRAALMVLGDIEGDEALRTIGSLVKDPVAGVARLAVMILADRPLSSVMKYLLDAMDGKHTDVIVAAIEAAQWGSSGKLIEKLCRLVAHKDGSVRSAARKALLVQQVTDSVSLLIENLRRYPALRKHYAKALTFLTRQDFGEDWRAWNDWWEKNRQVFKMPPPPHRSKVTFFGTAVTSNRVVFVIDVSGSMSQRYKLKKPLTMRTTSEPEKSEKVLEVVKIEMAKRELINAITRLPFDARFNIVFYNHDYKAWRDGLQRATYRNKQAAIDFVKSFKPNGRTNIYDSLMFALKNKGVDTVYLLSDGLPNTGSVTDPEKIIEEITSYNKGRVVINTFGFGLKSRGRRFMRELAERNRGSFLDM